jgi:glucose dehydrogenase
MTLRHALHAASALGAASLAAAHHRPAMFDMTTTVVFEGTDTKVDWGKPHTYMEIETVVEAGGPVVQNVEAGPTDVLFTGGREGYFQALDARTGALLWKVNLGAAINSGPISYRVGDKQYISIVSGLSLSVFALDD